MDSVTNYQDIVDTIKPLDLIAFRGADFVSNLISTLENDVLGSGQFTHVGIVVTSEILPSIKQLKPNKLYVWESTSSIEYPGSGEMTPDIVSNKGKFGVQIRDLEDVIRTYTSSENAKIALCKLKNNPYPSAIQRIIVTLEYIHEEYGNRLYELNLLELISSLFVCCRKFRDDEFKQIKVENQRILINYNNNKNNKWFFCSELVALIYKDLRILPPHINEKNIVPMNLLGYNNNNDSDYKFDIVEIPIYMSI